MGDDVVRRKALHEFELRLCLEHPQENVLEDILLAIQLCHDIHQAKTVFGGDGGQGLLKSLPAAGAVVFDEESGHQAKVAGGGRDGVDGLPAALANAGFVKLGDKGRHKAIAVAGVNGFDGLRQELPPGISGFGFSVVLDEKSNGLLVVHDVRGGVFHNILAVAIRNAAHGGIRQRFGPVENRSPQVRPVNEVPTGEPFLCAVSAILAMRACWPDNRAHVPPKYGIPPFSGGWCSIISGHKLTAVKGIPQGAHGLDEFVVVLPGPLLDGSAGAVQRAPLLDFLNIFHDDDFRQNGLCVFVDGPGENTEPLVPGLSALCL